MARATFRRFWSAVGRYAGISKSHRPSTIMAARRSRPPLALLRLEDLVLPSAATVLTDRPVYVLGQSATITAGGFLPGETVRFQVLHTDGRPNTGPDNAPWTVTDGSPGDLDGAANGTVQTTWGVVSPSDVGSSFAVSASGQSSGATGQATFTDSPTRNLVVNGGFETGDFSGWAVTGNTGFTGVTRDDPHSGSFAAHLGPIGSLGFITQTQALSTVPEAQYTLSWWMEVDPGAPNEFRASWNGTVIFDGVNMPAEGYRQYTFTVKATSTQTTLQFGYQHDPAWINLDDISVQLVTPTVNQPPVLADPGNKTVNESTPLNFGLSATDPNGEPLTYSILNGARPGMNLTAGGSFSWTPTEAQDGSYPVTFGVSDGNGGTDQKTITVTVNEVNTAPSLTVPGPITGLIKTTPVTFTATASDPDTINPGSVPNTLTFGLVGDTYGATINPTTGVFSWTPTLDQDSPFSFTVSVTDKGSFGLPDAQALTTTAVVTVTTVPAGIDANGNLLIVGHSTADTILIDATNPAAAAVTIDGTAFGPFAIPTAGHIVVHAFDGGNTITVRGGVLADVTTGAGDDTIVADNLSAGTLTVDGGGGSNTVLVNTGGGSDTVTVSNGQVVVAGGPAVSYTSVQTLTVNTAGGADAVTVNALGAGLPGQINVNAGGDDDRVTVNLGAGIATNISVDGGTHTAGDSVTVNGPAGPGTIALGGATLTSGPATVSYAGIENLAVVAGGDVTVATIATPPGGSIGITAGGAILDGNGPDDNFITNNLLLTAGTGIGTAADPLESVTIVSANPAATLTLTAAGGTGGIYLTNSGSLAVASATAVGSIALTAHSPLTVTGSVTSTGGSVTLTADSGALSVATGSTVGTGNGGDVSLSADTVSVAKTASIQTTGTFAFSAAAANLPGVNLGRTSSLDFTKQDAKIDLSGAQFGSLVNQGSTAAIDLSGANFSTLTNSGTGSAISLNGAKFDSLVNSGSNASITIDVTGAQFGTLTNTGTNVQISLNGANFTTLTNTSTASGSVIDLSGANFTSLFNDADGANIDCGPKTGVDPVTGEITQLLSAAQFGSLTNTGSTATIDLTGANFSTLTNSGTSATIISLNGAQFGTLTNSGTTAIISLNGANFGTLVNSAEGSKIDLTGGKFQTLVNGDVAEVAQIAANGANFSSLTDTAGQTKIDINGANFNTLVNAGSGTTISLAGANFTTLVNGGGAVGGGISIALNGASFDSVYNYGTGIKIGVVGANLPTASNGIVNVAAANFQTLVNAGAGSSIDVTGANFDTLVSTAVGSLISLDGANFNTLVSSGTGSTINVAGADFKSLQSSGTGTTIALNGVDFQSLVNSADGATVGVAASSFQFVENDGDNAALVLSSGGAGGSTVANNGNNVAVTYTGGPGDDVFVNDARGDTTHGNTVTLAVDLGGGNDRFVIGGTAVTGTLTGGTGDDGYAFVAGLTGDLTVSEPANADTDTLDFSNLTTGAVTVDLAVKTRQPVAPGLSLTLASDTGIENVVGTQFADNIRGNARNNQLLGADLPDDRVGNGPAWNGRTQTVYLDFDSKTQPNDHVYTQAERDAIQARLAADYHGPAATADPNTWWFHVAFTQSMPAGVPNVDYVTVYFNQPRADSSDGPSGVGGDSSEIDFGNRSFGGWASVSVKLTDPETGVVTTLIGGVGQPPEYNSADTADQSWQNDNWVRASSWIAAHEVGHLMGLRHADSFGPIGYGIHTPPGVNGFFVSPTYNGLTGAFETDVHLIATPALTGFTLNDLVGDTFFGEREAVKLAYDQAAPVTPDGNLLVAEQAGAHGGLATVGSQPLTLSSLSVPDTLTRGLNSIKQFLVGAVDVLGSIGTVGEKDVYRIDGRAGDLLNLQVMSEALNRYFNTNPSLNKAIDAVLTVYDSSGNVVATSDDEFEDHDPSIIDLRLPADGTYYLEVKTSGTDAHDGLNPTGKYELFAYRFDTANPTDGSDTLEGRGGDDTLAGGMGDDSYVFNGVNLGGDTIQEDVRYEAQNKSVGSRDSRDRLDFSNFGAAMNLNLGSAAAQIVAAGNLSLTLSSALGIEDVVLPQSFSATVNGTARDNTFIWANRPAGYTGTVTDTITGQAGTDTLDYGALTAGVTVNLGSRGSQTVGGGYNLFLPSEDVENVAGSATAPNVLTGNTLNNVLVGGAANDTMDGGPGNDILIGNAGDDMLTAASGSDILIGGTGADRIVGSAGNDILIAGTTDYDFVGYDPTKAGRLLGILAEWNNAGETLDVRQAAIAGTAGTTGTVHLNGGYYLNASTVHSDASVDKLTGSSGTNWFFVDKTAAVYDDNTPIDTITGNTKNAYITCID
jgi:hypothetical protein